MANIPGMRKRRSQPLWVWAAALAAGLAGVCASSPAAIAAPGTLVDDPATVHGSATDVYHCTSTFNPAGAQSAPQRLGVTISSDAGPQPPGNGPITLSNTTVSISLPASFLQTGVDAGIFGDGQTFPVTISPVVAGSNTVEATHVYDGENATTTVHVVGGVAQPLEATVRLPDTTWHPVRPDLDFVFSGKSVRVVVIIDFLSSIAPTVLTSECVPSAERDFVALGTLCAVTSDCSGTEATTTAAPTSTVVDQSNPSTAVPGATTLPRTGSSSGYAVFFGLSCIAAGALLLTRRRTNGVR